MPKVKAWLKAARLRTLPLSVSGIIVGTALAGLYGASSTILFILALCTTIGFQITSNFANDYGDGVKGTDNEERLGPQRTLQGGLLSRTELKRGILISSIINLMLVLAVVYYAFGAQQLWYLLLFLVLGVVSIWAAIKYTVGTSAYGYKGFGDIFVFLFFGLLGVLGSMFLYTKSLTLWAVAPAITVGLLSTAVLNLNNLRDCASDKNAGKNTLIVRLGFVNGKRYHYLLLLLSFLSALAFTWGHFDGWRSAIHLLAFVPIFIHFKKVRTTDEPVKLDPELKKVALSTFLWALLFYFAFNNFL